MSTKKGLVLTALCLFALAVTATWSLSLRGDQGYPWASKQERTWTWSTKKKVKYHPPLLVDIGEGCEVVITDTDPDHVAGDPPQAWRNRPIVFCNVSDYYVIHINFENDEYTTAGGSIYLNPGECFEALFRRIKKKGKGSGGTPTVTFEVKCVGPEGVVTTNGTLSWKFPPPTPKDGPPPGP